MFKACVPLSSQEDGDIYVGLDEVLKYYNKAGCTITKINADGEFESLMLRIEDELDVEKNIANPSEFSQWGFS